jgi:hypothetical protein
MKTKGEQIRWLRSRREVEKWQTDGWGNCFANRGGKKRLEVVDSKGAICGDIPTPGVFGKEAASC